MISFTSTQLNAWIVAFFFPLARILAREIATRARGAVLVLAVAVVTLLRRDSFTLGLDGSYYRN